MPAYLYVLVAVVFLASLFDPTKKGLNRAIFWLLPTTASFLTFLVVARNLGGALGAAGLTLSVMGVSSIYYWVRFGLSVAAAEFAQTSVPGRAADDAGEALSEGD